MMSVKEVVKTLKVKFTNLQDPNSNDFIIFDNGKQTSTLDTSYHSCKNTMADFVVFDGSTQYILYSAFLPMAFRANEGSVISTAGELQPLNSLLMFFLKDNGEHVINYCVYQMTSDIENPKLKENELIRCRIVLTESTFPNKRDGKSYFLDFCIKNPVEKLIKLDMEQTELPINHTGSFSPSSRYTH